MKNVEMEVANSLICKDVTAVKELMNCYAVCPEDREIMDRALLTGNPFDVNFVLSGAKSKTSQILDELVYCLGFELEK
jgi:hypothetical protein